MLETLQAFANSNLAQTLLIAAITAVAARLFTARGRLLWSVSHAHLYLVPRIDADGAFPVRTQQIWFENAGRAAIEDVEIILNYPPQHLEIWDPRVFTRENLPDNRVALRFPNLAGREKFTISMIDTFSDLPRVVSVRWKNGTGRFFPMAPQRVWPRRVLYPLLALWLVGVTACVFVALQGILAAVRIYSSLP